MKKASTRRKARCKGVVKGEYTGVLLTPMSMQYKAVEPATPAKQPRTILSTRYEIDTAALHSQVDDRMDALLDHFNIERNSPQSWWWLARTLAEKSGIPGFQIDDGTPKKKQGRPVYWSDLRKLELWADVEVVLDEYRSVAHEQPTSQAVCRWFISGARATSRWREPPVSKAKGWHGTLCDRHTEGKALAVKIFPFRGPRLGWLPWKVRRAWIIAHYAEYVPADNPY